MATYGRLIRDIAAQQARSATPCRCGHPVGNHHERNPRFDLDYEPLVFHCTECDCRVDARLKEGE